MFVCLFFIFYSLLLIYWVMFFYGHLPWRTRHATIYILFIVQIIVI